MKILKPIALLLAIILLVACSEEHDRGEHSMQQNQPLLNSQIQAIEKAKGVEQLIDKQFQTQQQEIDQASK